MSCYLCGAHSQAARCVLCCKDVVSQYSLFEVALKSTISKVPRFITMNLRRFDDHIAIRGDRNKTVSWEHIDTITKGCIDHA